MVLPPQTARQAPLGHRAQPVNAIVDLGPRFTPCVDRRELRRLEGGKAWLQTEVNPLPIGIPLAVRVKQARVRNLN